MTPKLTLDQPGIYRICVQGKLDEHWSSYFEEMVICFKIEADGNSITILTGELADQAAVQGVMQKLYNLGFPLISAEKIDKK